jgi:hypothetical protein
MTYCGAASTGRRRTRSAPTGQGLRPPDCSLHNMRAALLLALLMLLSAGIAEGAARKSHPYRTRWKHATVGKGALGRVAAGAGVAQLRKTPRKYGGGASGFGKRLGAGFRSRRYAQRHAW